MNKVFTVVGLVVLLCWASSASGQLTFPYSGSAAVSGGPVFEIRNTATSGGYAGKFELTNLNNPWASLYGKTAGSGPGLYGESQNGRGVYGLSHNGEAGVKGLAEKSGGYGVLGVAHTGTAAIGVYGVSVDGRGVVGVSTNGEAGVKGLAERSGGYGVLGVANSGTLAAGLYGASLNGRGVVGVSTNGEAGVKGVTDKSGGYGVQGIANTGVSSKGVYGQSTSGYGVHGHSTNGSGVYGSSQTAIGVHGSTAGSGYGVYAYASGSGGVPLSAYRTGSGYVASIQNSSASNTYPVLLVQSSGTGPSLNSQSFNGTAGRFETVNAANSHDTLIASSGGSGRALLGIAQGTGGAATFSITNASNTVPAVYASTLGTGPALRAVAGGGYAGYFSGNVYVSGSLSKASGSFKIDHPLDPEHKYLYHSFVESPDMMNVYNGNVTLDSDGQATVQLPDWFEALNKEFRYQLTCVGGFAPVYVSQKVANNQFKIAGGTPGLEVSWQVTGIRQDAWANAHRIPVEEDKPAPEQGSYLHPQEFGQPKTMGVPEPGDREF